MKKVLISMVIVFVFIVVIVLILGISNYNALVDQEVSVEETKSQVVNRLNQRQETIAQLLPTVEGLRDHAENIYQMITDARNSFIQAKNSDDVEGMIEADIAQIEAVNQLLITIEDNPNFRTTDAFLTLMDNITALENALSQSRRDYNTSVATYNAAIRKFPRNIVYRLFSFDGAKPYWKINDGADEIPQISFN